MKKRILFITFAAFVIVNYLCVGSTLAWFVSDSGSADGGKLNSSLVSFVMHGQLISDSEYDSSLASDVTKYIVPGDDLLYEDIYFENRSIVNSRLMIKMQYRVQNGDYLPIVMNDEYFEISFTTGYENSWYYDSSLGGWCYGTVAGGEDILPQNQNIYFIDKLRLNEEFGNADAGKNVVIRIIYLARQAEFMQWTSIGEEYYSIGTVA